MRILHVIRTLNPSSGGPPRVAVRLAAGQASLGHQVRIATRQRTDPIQDLHDMTKMLPGFDRVEVVEIAKGGKVEDVFGFHARPILRRLIDQSDVVHLHDVWDSLVRIAGGLARQLGKPYVLQPNDSLNPWPLQQKKWKKVAALVVAYRRLIEGSSVMLFGHTEERRLVTQSGFRVRPVVAGLGGVYRQEIEPFPEPGGFFRRVPQLAGRPFVVFLSRFHPKKGMDFLAEGFAIAARSLPDLQLVVIGHDEGAQKDFEARVALHGLTQRVHLVGPMHGAAKWEAYRDATCFCLPSRDEAFTVAIVEALSCGLPVIISESCHFEEVAQYGAGFVVPLEPAQIGQGMVRLGADRALRDDMSRAARRLFEERLCFDRVPQDVVNAYEACIEGRFPAAPVEVGSPVPDGAPRPASGDPNRAPRRPTTRMRVLVNATNIRTGGGVQKAVEFIRASMTYPSEIEFSYAVSDIVADNLQRLVDIRSVKLAIAPVSPARPWDGRITRRELTRIERSVQPDVVFSIFGPTYHVFRSPHLMGFAVPWITHPNPHAWGTLRGPVDRARMWAWCRYVEYWTRFADRWVLETNVAAEGLARVLGRDRARFRVVPNVCADQYHRAAQNGSTPDDRFRKDDASDFNLLVFSAWYPHKNLELVPAVAAEIRKRDPSRLYRFFLTFDRSSSAWERIARDARQLGVERSVINLGPIPVADGPRAYVSSDALFLPTVLETFTASYTEAMVMSRPIVTSDLSFAHDLCGDAAQFFPANDAVAAAEAIARVAGDEALRNDLVSKGRLGAARAKSPREVYDMVVEALESTRAECRQSKN